MSSIRMNWTRFVHHYASSRMRKFSGMIRWLARRIDDLLNNNRNSKFESPVLHSPTLSLLRENTMPLTSFRHFVLWSGFSDTGIGSTLSYSMGFTRHGGKLLHRLRPELKLPSVKGKSLTERVRIQQIRRCPKVKFGLKRWKKMPWYI
jgi:hypothetical protein